MPSQAKEGGHRKCLLVLGMHRSGTSALSGTLASLGALRPKREMQAHFTNSKGFFEPSVIVQIHDRLLADLGSSWADWRQLPIGWCELPLYARACEELEVAAREDFGDEGVFLLKDPRICRFVGLWIDVARRLHAELVTFHIYREPAEVAASLRVRDGIDESTSFLLWLRHVLEAEFSTRRMPRAFVSFKGLLANREEEMSLAFRTLATDLSDVSSAMIEAADAFLDPSLKHQSFDREALGAYCARWVQTVILGLERLRRDPYDGYVTRIFDRIRSQLNAACELFGPAAKTLADKCDALEQKASELQILRSERDALFGSLKAVTWLADEIPRFDQDLSAVRQQITELGGEGGLIGQFTGEQSALRERLDAEGIAQQAILQRLEQLQADNAAIRVQLEIQADAADRTHLLEREIAELRERLLDERETATEVAHGLARLTEELASEKQRGTSLVDASKKTQKVMEQMQAELSAKMALCKTDANRLLSLRAKLERAEAQLREQEQILRSRRSLVRTFFSRQKKC